MKFDIKLLSSVNCNVEDETKMFLMISLLHNNGKINDQSLNALFKSLREKTLIRKIGTYKSKITDKWYDDPSIICIYREELSILFSKGMSDSLTLENVIYYTHRYLNKPHNYAIDYIYFQIVSPIVKSYSVFGQNTILKSFCLDLNNVFIFNHTEYDKYEVTGYCCEDCDGSYEDYKMSQYSSGSSKRSEIEKIENIFKSFLSSKKKNLDKSPNLLYTDK